MKRESSRSKRKATAGIIAAVILFAMLFTVGSSYFMFVNSANLGYIKSLATRTSGIQGSVHELLTVTTLTVSSTRVGFYVNNTGGINANITAVFVMDSSGNVLKCDGRGLPGASCSNSTPALPIAVTAGKGSATIDTGYTYVSGTLTVKVLTERGNAYTSLYPPSAASLIQNALTAGSIGDLAMTHSTWRWYNVTSASCGNGVPGASGKCLSSPASAFTMKASVVSCSSGCSGVGIAFSVRITNLNSDHKDMYLDQYTVTLQINLHGNNLGPSPFFIISNQSTVILNQYTQIKVVYNVPQTILFASSKCVTVTQGPAGSGCANYTPTYFTGANKPSAGDAAEVFMMPHGWEETAGTVMNWATVSLLSANYGQNLPYVTELFV